MNKRTFLQTLGFGVASAPFWKVSWAPGRPPLSHPAAPLLYPPTIQRGDTVGIITPSSPLVDDEGYAIAERNFSQLGLTIKWGLHVGKKYGYLAGTDDERLADLHDMFSDPEIKAIVCLRGGSGAARLLDRLDYALIARNPKIFMGYSDITAYHQAIHTQTGLVTFHGAVANSVWTPMVTNQFEQLFFHGRPPVYTTDPYEIRTITPGIAEGRLLGGNLTVLTGIAGSKYFPQFKDSILFLEDIGEQPYRIDRMLSQLALSGALSAISGFVFGKCTDCGTKNVRNTLTLEQILDHYIKPLGIPAYQGARIGHIDEQFILPIGVKARLDAARGSLQVDDRVFGEGVREAVGQQEVITDSVYEYHRK